MWWRGSSLGDRKAKASVSEVVTLSLDVRFAVSMRMAARAN